MKILRVFFGIILFIFAFSLNGLAQNGDEKQFYEKLPRYLPDTFDLKNPDNLSFNISPKSNNYNMPIYKPDSNKRYYILNAKPNPNIRYYIRQKNLEPRLDSAWAN